MALMLQMSRLSVNSANSVNRAHVRHSLTITDIIELN